MYKLLVVSDTHGFSAVIEAMVAEEPDIHGIMHLGDGVSDLMQAQIPAHIERHCVNGNCDESHSHPRMLENSFNGVGVAAAHGHLFNVKQSLSRLSSHLAERAIPLGFYGHTHEQGRIEENGVHLYNPGHGASGEYLIATFSEQGYAVEFKETHVGE